ncbi:trypsin-like serine protease [Pendulispora rubella]|uniref:Trypsin-like serine protease n=1 Tax=Pendulispora rubella TaxID=2741070 RepID=A0ABZ2KU90_9BACT
MKHAVLFIFHVSAVLAASVTGCGGETADVSAQTSDEIVGGTVDPGDPAVVAVYARAPGATQGALCTGEVISPTVVLTAAHCITEVDPGAIHYVVPGPVFQQVPSSQWLATKEVHADPAFDASNLANGHDIGVVILAQPTNIVPIPFIRTPLPSSVVGKNVRLVGYGLDNGVTQTGAGTKRQVTVSVVSMNDKTLETGNLLQKACNGDSGGPALLNIDGKETIVGMTSYGLILCLLTANYTRVDLYTSFIDQYLQ